MEKKKRSTIIWIVIGAVIVVVAIVFLTMGG